MAKKSKRQQLPRTRRRSPSTIATPAKSDELPADLAPGRASEDNDSGSDEETSITQTDNLDSDLWSDPHERLQQIRSTIELQDFQAGLWTARLPADVAQAGTVEEARENFQRLADLLEGMESKDDHGRIMVIRSLKKLGGWIGDTFFRNHALRLLRTDSYSDFFREVHRWRGRCAEANWFILGTEIGILTLLSRLISESRDESGAISVSGATGEEGNFQAGDTVVITALWTERVGCNKDGDIAHVTVDFSAFAGPVAVKAIKNQGIWKAQYQIAAGGKSIAGGSVTLTSMDQAGKSKVETRYHWRPIGPAELKRLLLRPRPDALTPVPDARRVSSPSAVSGTTPPSALAADQNPGIRLPSQAERQSARLDPANAVRLAHIISISPLAAAAEKITGPRRRLLPCLRILSKSTPSSELAHVRRLGEVVGRADYLPEFGRAIAARCAENYARELAAVIEAHLSSLFIEEALLSDDDMEETPNDPSNMMSSYSGLIFNTEKETVTDSTQVGNSVKLSGLEYHLLKRLDDAGGQRVSRSRLREYLESQRYSTTEKDVGTKINRLKPKIHSLPVIIDRGDMPGYRLLKKG